MRRLTLISEIKTTLLYKDNYLIQGKKFATKVDKTQLIQLFNEKGITDKEKYSFIQKDFFHEQVIVIILETKEKLNSFLQFCDNGKEQSSNSIRDRPE